VPLETCVTLRRIQKLLCLPPVPRYCPSTERAALKFATSASPPARSIFAKLSVVLVAFPWGANQTPIYPLFASTATCRDANTSIAHQILLSPSSPRPTSPSCPCRSGHCGPQAYQTPDSDRHSSPIFAPSDQSAFLSNTHPRIRSQPSCGRCHSSLRDLHEVFPPKSVSLASEH
jgi:hypothetical protein